MVIFRGKVLLLYKSYKNKYDGWVLPKGTVEFGETHEETALREVLEETGIEYEVDRDTAKKDLDEFLLVLKEADIKDFYNYR